MNDQLQERWMKAAQCEELTDSTLMDNLGVEIIVAALKSDSLQVRLSEGWVN